MQDAICSVSFEEELERLINKHHMENGSNTPDFVLAQYLMGCLSAFNAACRQRAVWDDLDAVAIGAVAAALNKSK